MSADEELARRVDDAVNAVDGVIGVYASRSLAARVVRTALSAEAALSTVKVGPDGSEATVSVGIDDRVDAIDTVKGVEAAVRDVLGDPTALVVVRVSRIVAHAR